MRQNDENFVSMCHAVDVVLDKHESTWATIVAFKNQVTEFKSIMMGIQDAMGGAEVISTGATDDKVNAELKAVKRAVNLAKRASVYALIVDNKELHDQLRVTKTSLLRRPDTLTLSKLKDIHSRLSGIIAELADYGVLPADLSALRSEIEGFESLIARPRTLIVERKGYNQEVIPELLTDMRVVLYKMDSLVNIFEETDFKREYKDARIIINLGTRHDEEPIGPEM